MNERVQLKRKSFSAGPRGKPILTHKLKKVEKSIPIIEDGKDISPKSLNPDIFTAGKERQLSAFDVTCSDRTEPYSSGSITTDIFKSKSMFRTEPDRQAFSLSTSILKGSTPCDPNSVESFLVEESEEKSDISTILTFRTNSEELDVGGMPKAPQHISLSLNETDTFIVLDIPSYTVIKDTDEGWFLVFKFIY